MHVDAQSPGRRDPDERVQVGAVHVEEGAPWRAGCAAACTMSGSKTPSVLGTGHHQRGHVVVLERARSSVARSSVPAGVDGDLHDVEAGEGGRGRVGAVRGVGDQDLLARVSPRVVPAPRIISMPVSSPCAPAAGCSVTRAMPVIAIERLLQLPHELQGALHRVLGLQRVEHARAPRRRATSSLIRGLYFMVQEPSG